MPFDDDQGQPKRKIGLKLNNKNSAVAATAKINTLNAFNEDVSKEVSKIEDYKQRAWDLSVLYKSFVEDRTLKENKGPIVENLEKETMEKLIALASEMNADENQEEGIGSVAICMLLMKCLLVQRNTINSLGYELDKVKKQLFDLQKNKQPESK